MVSERPIYVKKRFIPFSLEDTVNKEVNDMLKLEIIEPFESPFCSPIVIVPKKDGTNRFCIDFRLLNRQTIFDSEQIPDADEMYATFARQKYFSKIDLSKGLLANKTDRIIKTKNSFQNK